MFKKEYLIKYIKLVDKEKTHRTVIDIGVSANNAWEKTTQQESNFNGLALEDIKKL